ncbi:hypothetical protein ACFO9Q_22940 [Paenibacillus sp. GCM10023252]|uniref:hypothetical protein n=1 Tax=Paenibacillus sp. GCM10023252 TaxID=3252649 RepID=UPI003606CC94
MGLEYRILWFEDDADIVAEKREVLDEFLMDYGFKLNIHHHENGRNLEELIKDDYDLILTDLNLSEEDTGDKILENLRSHNILTEVLFYSSNATGINDIITRHKWVERVSFLVGAKELLSKIKQLISLTIKKLQEVNTMRGLVMSETSELDVKMTGIILDLISTCGDQDKKKQEIIDKVIINREERLTKYKSIATIEIIEQLCGELEANDRLSAINRLIKHRHLELGTALFSDNKDILQAYKTEILDVRNALAHSEVIIVDNKKVIRSHVNKKEVTFDEDTCKKIRRDLIKHTGNLKNLSEKIKSTL